VSHPPADSFAAFLRPKRALMVLLFAWTLAGSALLPLFLGSHLDEFLVGRPDTFLLRIVPGLAELAEARGWGLVPVLWALPVVAGLLGLLAQVGMEAVIWWLRLDRADHAWSGLTWMLRSWPSALAWTLAGAAIWYALSSLVDAVGVDAPILASLSLPVLWLLTAPFFGGNPANVAGTDPPRWWRPRWPGWLAPVLAVVALAALSGLEKGVGIANARIPLEGVAATVVWNGLDLLQLFVAVMLYAYVGFAWLNRRRRLLSAGERRFVWSWATLRVHIAAWLRSFSWLFAALPLMYAVVLQVHVLPQVAYVLDERGEVLAAPWSLLVPAMRFVTMWWWVAVLPLGTWGAAAFYGRLYARLGFVQPQLQAGAAA
jgi:hypothetical protein